MNAIIPSTEEKIPFLDSFLFVKIYLRPIQPLLSATAFPRKQLAFPNTSVPETPYLHIFPLRQNKIFVFLARSLAPLMIRSVPLTIPVTSVITPTVMFSAPEPLMVL
jgi:hypothetical protein